MPCGFNLCIKCDEIGGKTLVCSNAECPIVVHEMCVGVVRVAEGGFECPYCVSRKAYAELEQARKDVLLRKTALSLFIQKEKEISGSGSKKRKRGDADVLRNREGSLVEENKGEGVNEAIESLGQSENREKSNASSNGNDSMLGIADGGAQPGLKKRKLTRLVRNSQLSSLNVECSERSSPSDENPLKTKENNGPSKVNSPSEPSSPKGDHSMRSLPLIRESPRKTNKTKSTGEVRQKVSNHVGRKRLLWTEAEIEMIKKGVKQHACYDNKNIPWKTILEHGRHVFNSSREPQHLKDKWRTLLAKENQAK